VRGLGAAFAIGLLLLIGGHPQDGHQVPTLVLIALPFMAVLSVKGYLHVRRNMRITKAQLRYQRVAVVRRPTRVNQRKLRRLKTSASRQLAAKWTLAVVAFVLPSCLGMLPLLTAAAMRFAGLRIDSTSSYVRTAYCPLMQKEFPNSYTGDVKGDFCEIRDITLLMTSIGVAEAKRRHF